MELITILGNSSIQHRHFSPLWCCRPYKPFSFCEGMILAMSYHHQILIWWSWILNRMWIQIKRKTINQMSRLTFIGGDSTNRWWVSDWQHAPLEIYRVSQKKLSFRNFQILYILGPFEPSGPFWAILGHSGPLWASLGLSDLFLSLCTSINLN